MSCHRAVRRDFPSVYPRTEYLVGRIVVVVLKIVYPNEVGYRKVPDIACPRTVGVDVIDLINTPIIGGIPLEFSGVIALITNVLSTFVLG